VDVKHTKLLSPKNSRANLAVFRRVQGSIPGHISVQTSLLTYSGLFLYQRQPVNVKNARPFSPNSAGANAMLRISSTNVNPRHQYNNLSDCLQYCFAKKLLYLLDFFLDIRSVSEVEELESCFSFLPFVFLLLESADVELEVELESSLLELDSVELLEVAEVDEELLIPCIKQIQELRCLYVSTRRTMKMEAVIPLKH
jgi:hypothetical protein